MSLVIFAEPAISAKPCKRAFYDPSSRQHFEAVLVLIPLDDIEDRVETLLNPVDEVTSVGPIGPDFLDLVLRFLPEPLEKQPGTVPVLVPVLNVGSMNDHVEYVSDCIDNHVSLASPNAFASIVAPLAPRFCCLDALTVNNSASGLRISATVGALLFAKRLIDLAPSAIETPFSVVKNSALPGGAF